MGKAERPQFAPGWYPDISNEDYHASTGFSSSQIKTLIEHTPAHLKQSFIDERTETDNMLLGTLTHTLVLEPEKYDSEFVIAPDVNKRTKDGRAEWAAFEAKCQGQGLTPITESMLKAAMAMAESVKAHPMAGALLSDIIPESSVYWWYDCMDPDDDDDYSLMLKVRPDALSRAYPAIIDLKTTRDGSYTGFIKSIQNFYYHVSAAMYLEGVNQCKPLLEDIGHFAYTKFIFVCVESFPPYLTSVYELSPEYLDLGKTIYRRSLRILQHVVSTGEWDGYPGEIRLIEPPSWANRSFIV